MFVNPSIVSINILYKRYPKLDIDRSLFIDINRSLIFDSNAQYNTIIDKGENTMVHFERTYLLNRPPKIAISYDNANKEHSKEHNAMQ